MAVVALCAIGRSADSVKVDPKDFLGPNNTFQDRPTGISLTYPAGWEVIGGFLYNPAGAYSFSLRPLWPSEAFPTFYYNRLRSDVPRPADIEASLLRQARKQETDRKVSNPDYCIDSQTLVTRTIAGRIAMSFVAQTKAKQAEYILHIMGEKTFVRFSATGPVEDVLAIRREIDQMAETLQLP